MSRTSLELGRKGEEIACSFLKDNGYKIIKKNFHTKFGQLDIVAKDRNILCFIEVKTRRTDAYGLPSEAISSLKQRQISKVALMYLKENKLMNIKARFDVVSILFNKKEARVDLIKDAFALGGEYAY
jgi:putative endonuclease